jgi:WD40 repeat protein
LKANLNVFVGSQLAEESQSVFNACDYSLDCVRALDPTHFATGSQSGEVSVWDTKKKKPVFTTRSHPFGWVSSVGSVFGSDILVSGSWNSPLVFHSLKLDKGNSKKFFTFPCVKNNPQSDLILSFFSNRKEWLLI